MGVREVNFDGLVGPTHNYAGLSHGNVASEGHGGQVSFPKKAALQGLAKMRYLLALGLPQGVFPPQERPHMPTLRAWGFSGTDSEVLAQAAKQAPALLSAACSASPMWAANAATVAPDVDSGDGRTHFTPANLMATVHRSLEPGATGRMLRTIFTGAHFAHHAHLPGNPQMGDEGAANHTRLTDAEGRGVHFFVYGRAAFRPGKAPVRYPARQTLEASQAVARLHGLSASRTVFAQQNPEVIDAGVFHNDVISVGNAHVLFAHEDAFLDRDGTLTALREATGDALMLVEVPRATLPVADAVSSYLFNSQLVTLPDGAMALISPQDCEANDRARTAVEAVLAADNPIAAVHYLDVRQSMDNGGGPACLRLRVPLSDDALTQVHGPCLLDEGKITALEAWVNAHYRDELAPNDLADPQLLLETRTALDALTQILELGSLYDFQREA